VTHVAPGIGDYGVIGDCQSAALISRDGSLDWLCWPRFDSRPFLPRSWTASAAAGGNPPGRRRRCDAAVSARHECPGDPFSKSVRRATLTDFMPLADQAYRCRHLSPDHAIIRLLRCKTGAMTFRIRFSPRPNFARDKVLLVDRGKLGLRLNTGHGMMALHSGVRFEIHEGTAEAVLSLNAGEEFPLILTYSESSPEVMPFPGDAGKALERTVAWWRKWVSNNCYAGPYHAAVARAS